MNNSSKIENYFVPPFTKGGLGGIFLVLCLFAFLLLSSCGGGSGSGTTGPAMASIAVDWASGGASASFSSYSNAITAKASVDGGAFVDGKLEGGRYNFTFSDLPDGDYTMAVEFYYSGNKIGSAEVAATLKGGEVVSLTLSATNIKFEGDSASVTDAVTNVAASDAVDLDVDGLSDKKEKELGTDPTNPDTDGDGVPDGVEVASGLNPLTADTDGDGSNDKQDAFPLDSNESLDTDKDKIGDNADNCVNAANAEQEDTNADGVGDVCAGDDDGDGVLDADELAVGTDIKKADTDGDGLPDGVELKDGTDPLETDTDDDGVNDKEDAFSLDPQEAVDSDKDKIGDNSDNCPALQNSEQKDYDLDGKGDECDENSDNDGLLNSEETTLGTDMAKTDPLKEDSDGDGWNDGDDTCPAINSQIQTDSDNDGFGQPCDCADVIGELNSLVKRPGIDAEAFFDPNDINPAAVDDPDLWGMDSNCDSIDGDKTKAVFLNGYSGNDGSSGEFGKQVKTLVRATQLAKEQGKDVYVAGGTYSLNDIELTGNVDLYGGFSNKSWLIRDVKSSEQFIKTVLSLADAPVTLRLDNLQGPITIDGFSITNGGVSDVIGGTGSIPDDYDCNDATVYISNSAVTLSNNIVNGSDDSLSACAVIVDDVRPASAVKASSVILSGNRIDAMGDSEAAFSSDALLIINTKAQLLNNIIIGGDAENSAGARFVNSEKPLLVNNTIDGGSDSAFPSVAVGLSFNGSVPTLINNLIYTKEATDQYPILVEKGSLNSAELKNNLVATFPQGGSNPLLMDMNGGGTAYLKIDSGDLKTEDNVFLQTVYSLASSGNITFNGELNELLDEAAYNLVDGTGDVAKDSGLNTNVTSDYNGTFRAEGKFSIGAIEK